MIRERRNKEKLTGYYNKFIDEGIIDPNVHPWVAESWRRCDARQLNHETMPVDGVRLSQEELAGRLELHRDVLHYVDGLFEQNKQYFNSHNLSMILVDEDGYVLKNYALPFFQRSIEDIQGMRVLEEDVGTSSLSVARAHNVPFLMFGPEMWIRECHSGDACSAPISVEGEARYFLAMFSLDQNELPYDILLSLLMTMKYSLENYLSMLEYWKASSLMAEDIPAAVFWVNRDGSIRYCNERARKRLDGHEKLEDVFLNYEHIPVQKGFEGKKTVRKEITWITQDRTYEDVTSVLPVTISGRVDSVVVVTMAIEDLKTTIAHATGYSSGTASTAWSVTPASSWLCSIRQPVWPAAITISFFRVNRVRASSVWPMASIRPARGQRLHLLRSAVTKAMKKNWKKNSLVTMTVPAM